MVKHTSKCIYSWFILCPLQANGSGEFSSTTCDTFSYSKELTKLEEQNSFLEELKHRLEKVEGKSDAKQPVFVNMHTQRAVYC